MKRTIDYDPSFQYSALHLPSMERWVIIGVDAYANKEYNCYIAGWPHTIARSCDLVLWKKFQKLTSNEISSRNKMFGSPFCYEEPSVITTKSRIFAVDFDGTLVSHRFPEIGSPNSKVVDFVKALQRDGHKLILWTCRNDNDPALGGRKVLEEAAEFCSNQLHIEFDAINANIPELGINPMPKVYYDYLIDDRAFIAGNRLDDLAKLHC